MEKVKNIILTGGSKGLGLEITTCLLHSGYHVHVINRTLTAELKQLKNQYEDQLYIYLYDLTNVDGLTTFLKQNFPVKLTIGGFVNNAAIA